MPLTPAGVIAGPLDVLRTMLANCAQFLEWVEQAVVLAEDVWPVTSGEQIALALTYVKLVDVDFDATDGFTSPMAIIELPLDVESESIAVTGDGLDFDGGQGVLDVHFFRTVPAAYRSDKSEAWIEFSGYNDSGTIRGLSGIIDDLKALSAAGTHLYITNFSVTSGPGFVDDTEFNEMHTIVASLRIRWGVAN